jgi:DNA (cytosine-5)-methyltransferase 1
MLERFPVVDLFCGVGGLSHGFVKEKFNVVAGIDFDLSCKYAFEHNNNASFLHSDLTTIHSSDISRLYPQGSVKILVGCAPCQAYSTLAQKDKRNDKWKLLYSFSRIIGEVKPHVISMENVPQLVTYNEGRVFKDFLQNLKAKKYKISYKVVNASDYGVPQKRSRLILFASKLGEVEFTRRTHADIRQVTVEDAIGHLPAIEDGESHPLDLLHRARKLSELNKARIKATPEGGGWKDWDENLVLDCHKKDSGKTFRSVYGRMNWNETSPTLTTQCTGYGNGRYGHPEQDRAISLREAAILQSFPEDYQFIDPTKKFTPTLIERHIGNAVPVRLGQAVARSIKKHLMSYA